MTRDAKSIITAAYDQGVRGSLYQTSTISGRSAQLVHMTINRVHGMTIRDDRDAYLLADIRGNDPSPHPIVIRIAGLGPFVSPQTRRGPAGLAQSDDAEDCQTLFSPDSIADRNCIRVTAPRTRSSGGCSIVRP
jgi:hypothetical protein